MVGKHTLREENTMERSKPKRRHSDDVRGYRPRPKASRFADVARVELEEQSRDVLKTKLLKSIGDNIEKLRKDPEEVVNPVL